MIEFLNTNFTWLLILILFFNLSQRKLKRSDNKRKATLYFAIMALVFYIVVVVFYEKKISDWYLIIPVVLLIAIGIIFRKQIWPFRAKCVKCGAKLSWDRMIGYDDNLCIDCYDEKYPEEAEARKAKTVEPVDQIAQQNANARTVEEVNWDYWEATDPCTLTYVENGDEILLIEKKQGFGTGLINAPGGHIELEETAIEAAIRETKEETGLDVKDLEFRGKLYFHFIDGMKMTGYVYFTKTFSGELQECEEARPFWCKRDEIPLDKMWADDKHWLPQAMEGKKFTGYFICDNLDILDEKVIFEDDDEEI